MHKTIKQVVIWVVAVLAVLLLILCFLLAKKYRDIAAMHIISRVSLLHRSQGLKTLTVSDVSFIQPWMTFDYIDHAFGMPANYLETDLQISDSRYPRLVIGRYAVSIGQDQNEFVQKVKDAVTTYFNSPLQ